MAETQPHEAVVTAAGELALEHAGELHVEHAEPHYPRHVSHPPELPHFVQLWWEGEYQQKVAAGEDPYGTPEQAASGQLTIAQTLHIGRLEKPAPFVDYAPWENNLFAAIAALALMAIFWLGTRGFRRDRREAIRRPTRGQVLMELIGDGMDNFCKGILGPVNGRLFLPFVAALFFFVLAMNLMGMVPLMKAPTASLLITGSLALVTFFVYLYVAVTKLGLLNFIHHLMGSPPFPVLRNWIPWALGPLIALIELVSWFFAKPVSLALRLFGNILGKDILFGVMLGLGLLLTSGMGTFGQYIGFPLTFPFYFLGLLLSAIQALIFALLSAIYILLVLPHDHEHDHEEAGHEAGAH